MRSGHNDNRCLEFDWHDRKLKQSACNQHPSKLLYVGDERPDRCYYIRVEMPTGVEGTVAPRAGWCLDNPSQDSLGGGNRMQVLECNDTDYQHWKFVYLPDKQGYNIINKASGFCLDRRTQEPQEGGAIQQYVCNGTEWQLWHLDPKR